MPNTKNWTREQVADIVYEETRMLFGKALALTPEIDFRKDLNADSLDSVEIALALEDRLDVTLPDEQVEKITTIQSAVDLLCEKVGVQ